MSRKPVTDLKGVGDALGERLAGIHINNVLDVLTHYPRRYVDRTKKSDIASLSVGEEATVFGEIRKVRGRRTRQGRSLVEVSVTDGESFLAVTFFNQPWRDKQLAVGTEAAFFGKLDVYRGKRQMTNPVVDVIGRAGQGDDKTGVIVPIYPQSGKAEVYTWQLRGLVREVLRRCEDRSLADPVPSAELHDDDDQGGGEQLAARWDAYRWIHAPNNMGEVTKARERLVFDEFLRMQLGLVARKRALEANEQGITHVTDGRLAEQFIAKLPFDLTNDQLRANAEIAADLARPSPMHRLLQGDVGSGKTVVALTMLLHAVEGGHQGALMAPTEVLAEQHFLSARRMLDGLTVDGAGTGLFEQHSNERALNVALLTNRTTAAERKTLHRGLLDGSIDIVVGTHALLYEGVDFKALGAVVIDEQHRFGVEQRSMLRSKAGDGTGTGSGLPDVLVMTATPIPRTAAMLVYGDLDRSELREMPPGRTPITTKVVGPEPVDRAVAYERLRTEVEQGHQAYLVCPLVEGSDKVQAKAVTEEFERLQHEELKGLRLGLLHGQLPGKDKEAVMGEFRDGRLDALVSTTVIEVGVDVANATVMIIEDADRFGLSQLHQLRGRVGRGGGESWCFLLADASTDESKARLDAMASSTDGFALAERDLEIRGAGEVFGERQSGFSDLKIARIPRDQEMVSRARRAAERILDADPDLAHNRSLADEVEDLLGEQVEFLFKS
ncbi:MAG TPA: ATP-dependent DNA helicase RecG [Acidimicrobiia bacterium]